MRSIVNTFSASAIKLCGSKKEAKAQAKAEFIFNAGTIVYSFSSLAVKLSRAKLFEQTNGPFLTSGQKWVRVKNGSNRQPRTTNYCTDHRASFLRDEVLVTFSGKK
jgi:hypothetical protein